jgi:hypothetical protein
MDVQVTHTFLNLTFGRLFRNHHHTHHHNQVLLFVVVAAAAAVSGVDRVMVEGESTENAVRAKLILTMVVVMVPAYYALRALRPADDLLLLDTLSSGVNQEDGNQTEVLRRGHHH